MLKVAKAASDKAMAASASAADEVLPEAEARYDLGLGAWQSTAPLAVRTALIGLL